MTSGVSVNPVALRAETAWMLIGGGKRPLLLRPRNQYKLHIVNPVAARESRRYQCGDEDLIELAHFDSHIHGDF